MRGYKLDQNTIDTCLELRREGQSINQICRFIGLSKSTVFPYIKPIVLLPEQKAELRAHTRQASQVSNSRRKGKSRPHNHVNKVPHYDAPLINCLAHFLFDGSVSGHQVCYYNRSLSLVIKQQEMVKKGFGLMGICYPQPSGVVRLTYNSVEFVNIIRLLHYNLLNVIRTAPLEWKRMFLKAFFDDEGSIYISDDYRNRRISGFQKDIAMLKLIQELLQCFFIDSYVCQSRNRVAYICIKGGRGGLLKFQKEISFSPGVTMNPERKNSRYTYAIEKRDLLEMAIQSYKRNIK